MDKSYVDSGLNKQLISDVLSGKCAEGETLKDYADKNRKLVKEQHNLGFKSHVKAPCFTCGHRICRCKDVEARQERENKKEQDDG